LLYAFVFFMAGVVPPLLSAEGRSYVLGNAGYWVPDFLAIAMALGVVWFTRLKTIPLHTVMKVGLVFLVVSNYGIAAAEFIDPMRLDMNGWMGLSWVAVWTPLYMVAVPTPPRRALVAMLASVSAVPVMIGYMVASHRTIFQPGAFDFFLVVVFPYLLIVLMGYVGARVVYSLGKQVTRAQELGSYRLIEKLGEGGMGQVWRAKHLLLARPAAIKLIRPDALGPSQAADAAVRRFEREAQVTAQLRSPHTVELWDFGVAADGSFY
jgi:serine/threonine-protein kinase